MQRTRTSRELAHRESDGIEVSLLWRPLDNRLTVAVADGRTGDAFELTARPENALDAFHHPFAYAALGGIARRTTETLVA
jgi:hypothetical protein